MFRPPFFIELSLLLRPVTGFAGGTPDVAPRPSPPYQSSPLGYEQKFAEFLQAGNHAIRRILLVRWPWPTAISSRLKYGHFREALAQAIQLARERTESQPEMKKDCESNCFSTLG